MNWAPKSTRLANPLVSEAEAPGEVYPRKLAAHTIKLYKFKNASSGLAEGKIAARAPHSYTSEPGGSLGATLQARGVFPSLGARGRRPRHRMRPSL